MNKFAATAAALAVAFTSFAAAAPANAANVTMSFGQQNSFVNGQCARHPNFRGCDDFRRNHGHWSQNDYRNWYQWNRPNLGNLGLGLFSFALGAAVVNGFNNANNNASNNEDSDHIDACMSAYRSYNPRTDMYLSYNNGYQRCRL